jgi:hypothetical protein
MKTSKSQAKMGAHDGPEVMSVKMSYQLARCGSLCLGEL